MSIPRMPLARGSANPPPDARLRRTRRAILDAFFVLVTERDYETIRVADIVERAQVGRSTFYEHFDGKDDVLAQSIAGPFGVLAESIWSGSDTTPLEALLEHFWQRRRLARLLFAGSLRRSVTAVLTTEIERRFLAGGRGAERLIVSTRLASVQLAGTLLTPIVSWLEGESTCSVPQLALLLQRVGAAALLAMTSAAPTPLRDDRRAGR